MWRVWAGDHLARRPRSAAEVAAFDGAGGRMGRSPIAAKIGSGSRRPRLRV